MIAGCATAWIRSRQDQWIVSPSHNVSFADTFTGPSEIPPRSPTPKPKSEFNIRQRFATTTFQITAPSPLFYINFLPTTPSIHPKNRTLDNGTAKFWHRHVHHIVLAILQPHRFDRLNPDGLHSSLPQYPRSYFIDTPASSNLSGNLSYISLARCRPTQILPGHEPRW